MSRVFGAWRSRLNLRPSGRVTSTVACGLQANVTSKGKPSAITIAKASAMRIIIQTARESKNVIASVGDVRRLARGDW